MGFSFFTVSDDGPSQFQILGSVDGLYNFQTSGTTEFFVHGGVAVDFINVDPGGVDSESASSFQFGFGGGAGVRIPIFTDNVKIRLGGQGRYFLEDDSEDFFRPSRIDIAGTFGLSVMVM